MERRCAQIPEQQGQLWRAPISVPDPDATPMQLESGETRGPKHRALPADTSSHTSPISVVVRSLVRRQWMTRTDQLTRTKMGMDYFFLVRAIDPGFSVGSSLLSHGGEGR